MPRFHPRLILLAAASLIPTLLAQKEHVFVANSNELVYTDSLKVFYRKRNGHACMMSIVFLILFPLGAISLHFPRPAFLRNVKVVTSVHVPIQILGLAMMIGAMGLGIDIANELHFFSGATRAHIVIGLLATLMIIVVQPAMGILQHLHFRKTGGKSVFGYIHRWNGRVAIILGMINQGLGFQLVGIGTVVHTHSLVRNFVILGVFASIWFLLVMWDWLKGGKKTSVPESREEKQVISETSI